MSPPGAVACLATAVAALAAPPPPTGPVANCTTSDCHTDVTGFTHLHGPVAAGACEMCHTAVDHGRHRFELKRTGAEMCSFCHLGKVDRGWAHVHEPVAEGKCVDCHDPHGSEHKMMLRHASLGELCVSCHADSTKGNHLHAPLAAGDCTACHRAHSSMHPALLTQPGRDLCLSCHGVVQATIEHANGNPSGHEQGFFLHDPMTGDCLQCHRPHASDVEGLLLHPPAELCGYCHTENLGHGKGFDPHGPSHNARACLLCHEGHAGTTGALLRDSPTAVCMNCHGNDLTRADGTVLASLAELTKPHYFRHGPLEDGCRGCHDAHNGANGLLLRKPFSGSFYQQFDTEAYALCFECHEGAVFETPTTTDLTGFRDGDVNLHYLHVTAPAGGGRNCRVCHSAHAAASRGLVREKVAFGEWQIPINFQPTETGGSCAAGCHRARRYDRVTPVGTDADTDAPAETPATPPKPPTVPTPAPPPQ